MIRQQPISRYMVLFVCIWTISSQAQSSNAPAPAASTVSTNDLSPSSTNSNLHSKLFDAEDGEVDISSFLDTSYGFVPIVIPITEPAVGYGAGLGLVFMGRKEQKPGEPYQKPSMTMLGGMGTQNDSRGLVAGHMNSWMDGKLEMMVGGGYASVNLDFHGIGDGPFNDDTLGYNLKPLGGLVEARYRLGSSRFQAGLRYAFANTEVSFDGDVLPSQIEPQELDSRIGGVTPSLIYDSRNNFFTPTKGIYAKADLGLYREAIGSSSDFETMNLTFIFYQPLAQKLTLGIRTETDFSFNDVPFYVRPFISLRGAEMLQYVGEHAAEVEVELRWQLWKRFSLVGFGGTGVAWNDFERFENKQSIVTGGGGFRYEIARKFGLHMGIDVAFGPDDPTIYIQFGSAWLRP